MISVIGGGPAGSQTAYLLAKNGFKVRLFEEHKEVGKPVQCTGFVTSHIKEFINLDEDFVLNRVSKVKVYSKSKEVEFDLVNKNIVMDRARFDKHLFNRAKEAGAKVFLDYKYLGNDKNKVKIKHKNEIHEFENDKLVGADGPNSSVAKNNSMFGKRDFLVGYQARVKGKFDSEVFSVYLGYYCPGFFGWIVPENEKYARIGLAMRNEGRKYFEKFVKDKGEIVEFQGGVVPIYNPSLITEKNNVCLIGDAATQVKATTGGGIVYGLIAAKELNNSFILGKSYEKKWKKKLGNSLGLHLMLRKALNRFDDNDYDYLIDMVNSSKRTKSLISRYDREFPLILITKLILAQPRFLKYIGKVI